MIHTKRTHKNDHPENFYTASCEGHHNSLHFLTEVYCVCCVDECLHDTHHHAIVVYSFKPQVQSLVSSSSWLLIEDAIIPHPPNMIPNAAILCYVIVAGWNWHINNWTSL